MLCRTVGLELVNLGSTLGIIANICLSFLHCMHLFERRPCSEHWTRRWLLIEFA